MKVHQAEIVISAVAPKQYPESDLPEIALAGVQMSESLLLSIR